MRNLAPQWFHPSSLVPGPQCVVAVVVAAAVAATVVAAAIVAVAVA